MRLTWGYLNSYKYFYVFCIKNLCTFVVKNPIKMNKYRIYLDILLF